jgi:hypothetical protein
LLCRGAFRRGSPLLDRRDVALFARLRSSCALAFDGAAELFLSSPGLCCASAIRRRHSSRVWASLPPPRQNRQLNSRRIPAIRSSRSACCRLWPTRAACNSSASEIFGSVIEIAASTVRLTEVPPPRNDQPQKPEGSDRGELCPKETRVWRQFNPRSHHSEPPSKASDDFLRDAPCELRK